MAENNQSDIEIRIEKPRPDLSKDEAFGGAIEGAAKHPPDEPSVQIVFFYLDDDEYAFEVVDAVEVLRPKEITEVPRIPGFMKGVISVRGEMIPVMDLKMRLKGRSGAAQHRLPSSRILIGGSDDTKAGFLVDSIGGVKEVRAKSIEAPLHDGGREMPFLKGIVRSGDKTIRLLDIDKILDIAGA